jgi:hypothetical protein
MHQQLREYKVEEHSNLGVREQKGLNTTDVDCYVIIRLYFRYISRIISRWEIERFLSRTSLT